MRELGGYFSGLFPFFFGKKKLWLFFLCFDSCVEHFSVGFLDKSFRPFVSAFCARCSSKEQVQNV